MCSFEFCLTSSESGFDNNSTLEIKDPNGNTILRVVDGFARTIFGILEIHPNPDSGFIFNTDSTGIKRYIKTRYDDKNRPVVINSDKFIKIFKYNET